MYASYEEYEDISMDADTISDSTLVVNSRSKNGRNACAICGARPTGINFDVLTCSSCKAFFRRNGTKSLDQFVCRLSSDCNITTHSRRQCTACRLRKCFAMGMIKERIRTDEQNQRHRALVEENRRQKFHKYQQQADVMDTKTLREQHPIDAEPSLSCAMNNSRLTHIDLLFNSFLENTQQIIPDNFALHLNHNLTDALNSHCTPVSCLIAFFKQVFQFQKLPVDDRLLLLKNNIKILLPILTHLLSTTRHLQILIHHPGVQNVNNKIAGTHLLLSSIVPDDPKLLTLLIVLFLFCPSLLTNDILYDAGSISCQSQRLIEHAYNEYTGLLWSYILERSLNNERQAALTYMKLVTTILHLQSVSSEIYDTVECFVQIDQLHMMMQSILHLT